MDTLKADTQKAHQPCVEEMARLQEQRDELRRTVRQLEKDLDAILTAAAKARDEHQVLSARVILEASARLVGLQSRMDDTPSVYGSRS